MYYDSTRQAGVMNDVGDFDDEEVTYTKADINKAMTGLMAAMGDKATAADVKKALSDICGVSSPRDVPEEGYAKVIRALEELTAKYDAGKLKL
jgi:hypothetical protein